MNGERKEEILKLLEERPRGLTIMEIAEELDVSRITVSKYLEVLKAEGKIEQREVGRAKLNYAAEVEG